MNTVTMHLDSPPVHPTIGFNQAAPIYTDRGFKPVPVAGKTPVVGGATGYDGSVTAAKVQEWRQQYPKCNTALRAEGFIGLDVDQYGEKHGADQLHALETLHGALPPTVTSTARGAGESSIRFYRVPEGMRFETKPAKDIETVQRHHRVAVVAPSLHHTGAEYRWYGPDGKQMDLAPESPEEFAELPVAWQRALQTTTEVPERRNVGAFTPDLQAVRDGLKDGNLLPEHAERFETLHPDRYDTANAELWHLARLIVEHPEAPGLLTALNSIYSAYMFSVTAADRSAAERESDLNRSLSGAIAKCRADQAEALAFLEPYQPWIDAMTALSPVTLPEPARQGDASSWAEEDFEDVLDGTYAPVVPTAGWREDGHALFYAGCVNGLHGESESGKSWVAIYAAVQCVQRAEHVHYLDYESNRVTIISRMLRLGATPDQLRNYMHYRHPGTDPTFGGNPETEDYLHLSKSPASLIVFDGVNEALSVSGYSASDNDDIPKWMVIPKYLAQETNAAVVLIDHVPKSNGTARFQFGAQHKLAAVDGAQFLVDVESVLAPGVIGVLRLEVAKDRNGYVREHSGPAKNRMQVAAQFSLDSTDPRVSVGVLEAWDESKALAKGATEHSDRKANVLALFEKQSRFTSEAKIAAAYRAAYSSSITKQTMSGVLGALVDEGQLVADDSNSSRGIKYEMPYVSIMEDD